MTIRKNITDNTVTLVVEGCIDTNTSPELQRVILETFRSAKQITLNMEKVQYVSSAGLRALLIGHKTAISKGGGMELFHVPPAVRAVLDSVGLSKVLVIR